jgi:hypothetical protein
VFDFHLRLAPDEGAPGAARRAVAGMRPVLGPHVLESASLLVSEVVTNAVRHVRHRPNDAIVMHVQLHPDVVRVDVTDPGEGFDPADRRPTEPERGWGLRLLDDVADRWGVDRGSRNTVWFELRYPREGSGLNGMLALV